MSCFKVRPLKFFGIYKLIELTDDFFILSLYHSGLNMLVSDCRRDMILFDYLFRYGLQASLQHFSRKIV